MRYYVLLYLSLKWQLVVTVWSGGTKGAAKAEGLQSIPAQLRGTHGHSHSNLVSDLGVRRVSVVGMN